MFHADFHLHTWHSYDSWQAPRTVLNYARNAGLDAIAVTDHDEFDGSVAASSLAEDLMEDLICVKGMEVRTEEVGDVLALFIDQAIESRSFESVVEEIHDQGGLAVFPHPYRHLDEVPSYVLDAIDAVEGLNARSRPDENERARTLAGEHGLTMLGGSDAHTPWEIGRGRSVLDGDIADEQALKRAIIDGDVEWRGTESEYYATHVASYAMELITASTGFRRF